ncbi:MAG: hypothetical protein DME33_05655 [Verrucomicrobia bacterium]|nr:MAG: hypothetical protein DME33_05655 [Verrucomicrobiota bacterium]
MNVSPADIKESTFIVGPQFGEPWVKNEDVTIMPLVAESLTQVVMRYKKIDYALSDGPQK